MIALLASPLFRYGLAVVGMLAGAYGYAHHQGALSERAVWEKRVEAQAKEAARLIAAKIAENAALEAKSQALNTQLETDHATAARTIDAAHDAYNRAVAERVRLARSRPSCAAPGSAETTGSAGSSDVAAAGVYVSESSLRDLGTLAAQADELVATMTACRAWAVEHGRP